jgi:hypothetical protein
MVLDCDLMVFIPFPFIKSLSALSDDKSTDIWGFDEISSTMAFLING